MGERVSPRPDWLAHLDIDDAFTALRTDWSRAVLRALDTAGGQLPLAELVDAVLAYEVPATDPKPGGRRVRERVLTQLHHSTLPQLDGYGVVVYDTETKTVALEPAGESLLPLVEHADFVETRR